MTIKMKVGDCYCYLKEFVVNGIEADEEDFGRHYDHDTDGAEDYCCGNMQFDPNPCSDEVLQKYGITEDEYHEVCDLLYDKLSWGCCGWCS